MDAEPQPTQTSRDRSGHRTAPRLASEDGQISLIRTLLLIAVVGFVLFEVGAVLVNRYQVADIAGQAAVEANFAYFPGRNRDAAERRAETFVERNHATFISMTVDEQARTLSVTAEKTARTLLIHRIERLDQYRVAQSTQSAPLRG